MLCWTCQQRQRLLLVPGLRCMPYNVLPKTGWVGCSVYIVNLLSRLPIICYIPVLPHFMSLDSSLKTTLASEHQVTVYSECLTVLVVWMVALQLIAYLALSIAGPPTTAESSSSSWEGASFCAVRGSCKAIA